MIELLNFLVHADVCHSNRIIPNNGGINQLDPYFPVDTMYFSSGVKRTQET